MSLAPTGRMSCLETSLICRSELVREVLVQPIDKYRLPAPLANKLAPTVITLGQSCIQKKGPFREKRALIK